MKVDEGIEQQKYLTAREIARALKESNISSIRRVVECLGIEESLNLLRRTIEVEKGGGLLVNDGSRRRTPGGTFFHLVRQIDETILPFWRTSHGRKCKNKDTPPAFAWEDRARFTRWLAGQSGEAKTVKLTLIGRPGKVIERNGCFITTMKSSGKAPTLAKELPIPPAEPTRFVVFIAAKQWRRVADAIANPDDALIVEGYPAYDPKLPGMVLFAQVVTTKALQAAQRAKQQERARQEGGDT